MSRKLKTEVLIAGGGPVGLLTALACHRHGLNVTVVEKESRSGTRSFALALHPGTLELLDGFGLLDQVLANANRVPSLVFYEGVERMARIGVASEEAPHPFVAVIRQSRLEDILVRAVQEHGVTVRWSNRLAAFKQGAEGVTGQIDELEERLMGYAIAHREWVVRRTVDFEAEFLLGADGHHSLTRQILGLEFPETAPSEMYAVFEFNSDYEDREEIRVVFHEGTTNVLWPMRDGYFRWSFGLADSRLAGEEREKDTEVVQWLPNGGFPALDRETLDRLIAERAPWFTGEIDQLNWRMVVRFEKRLVESAGKGRVWLAGDAAHLAGPVGVQSMNVGFREGVMLAEACRHCREANGDLSSFQHYDRVLAEEWRRLLGLEGCWHTGLSTPAGLELHLEQITPCLPAGGADLCELGTRLGLAFR
ncbi:MAG: FAD-dependent monooxygenase [Puniceicoccaceae bacterium]|nr:MAG: FAD-dependent monooxygenase [Puniceicoccaceae bacterium]